MDQSIPEGSVVITPTDMYKELRDTHDEVRSIGPKLEQLTATVADKIGDHETRIRALENFRWKLAGAVTVLAFGASYGASLLAR